MSNIWDDAMDRASFPDDGTSLAEPQSEFPAALTQPLFSLLQLGKLEDTVTIGSHVIQIRTLTIGEELRVAQLVKEYADNQLASGRAYVTAVVAAAIESVNGQPLARALGPEEDLLPQKLKVVKSWYWETINHVYSAYNDLQIQQQEVFSELLKGADELVNAVE